MANRTVEKSPGMAMRTTRIFKIQNEGTFYRNVSEAFLPAGYLTKREGPIGDPLVGFDFFKTDAEKLVGAGTLCLYDRHVQFIHTIL